jgi:hypothetical protein
MTDFQQVAAALFTAAANVDLYQSEGGLSCDSETGPYPREVEVTVTKVKARRGRMARGDSGQRDRAARVVRSFLYRMLTTALALTVLFPAAAQRGATPVFPTEWRGNDKWCPQSDKPTRVIYTRHDECNVSDHITLTADRYERKKIVCRLLAGRGGMHHRGRIYHAVMSCQGEHERWFERADFFTPFPPDLLVVETIAQASTLAGLGPDH